VLIFHCGRHNSFDPSLLSTCVQFWLNPPPHICVDIINVWSLTHCQAMGWGPTVADWGDGMSASCTAGPTVRYCRCGWPCSVLLYHWFTPISCHFWDCKVLLVTSLTHVSSAITSVQTFTFTVIIILVVYFGRLQRHDRCGCLRVHHCAVHQPVNGRHHDITWDNISWPWNWCLLPTDSAAAGQLRTFTKTDQSETT